MSDQFHIEFSEGLPKLTFRVKDTPLAIRWFELLKDSLAHGGIKEANRLVNFDETCKENDLVEINQIINKLNMVWPEQVLPLSLDQGDFQQQLNNLHMLFEIYRGRVDNPPYFFLKASPEDQKRLERMNVLIHQLEGVKDSPRFVVTFEHAPRIDLQEEDYQYFKTTMEYGEVYINYCDTGRELIEAFQAQDNVVGQDNLRPLRYYSSDFRVYLPNSTAPLLEEKDRDAFNHFLLDKGFRVGDPKNSLGRIPVAHIDSHYSRDFIIKEIAKAGRIKSISLQ